MSTFFSCVKVAATAAILSVAAAITAQGTCPEFLPQWSYAPGSEVAKPGIYTGSSAFPGARTLGATATDASNNHWLFGGNGYDKQGNEGFLSDLWRLNPATGKWAFVSGNDLANRTGVYSGTNLVPGGRLGASLQADANGRLWLFGGQGCDKSSIFTRLNDLWRFDPSTGTWLWISGSDTGMQESVNTGAVQYPGARSHAASWFDADGNFWLFGGVSQVESTIMYYNDLWKYSTVENKWTFVSGLIEGNYSGNYTGANPRPGSRAYTAYWMGDDNKLWLFGGSGYPKSGSSGPLNDLWSFDIATSKWTWEGGSDARRDRGNYAGPTFYPSSRYGATAVKAVGGNVWLFGGHGYVSAGSQDLNDLWKLNINTKQWTLVGGNNVGDRPNDYSEDSPYPGGRMYHMSWIDVSQARLWVFGGFSFGGPTTNDFWKAGLTNFSYTVTKNTPKLFTPPLRDPLSNAQLSFGMLPNHGTALLALATTDTVHYIPDQDYVGSDSMMLTLSTGACGLTNILVDFSVENAIVDLNLDGNITPMDKDTDGDGFPDSIEEMLGVSATDYGITPTGSPDPGFNVFTLGTKALKMKPNKKTGLEKAKLKALLPAPAPASMLGLPVAVDLGGNTMLFTLDAKGKATIGKNKLTMKLKKGKKGAPNSIQLTLAMQGTFKDNFRINGPVDGNNNPSRVTLGLYFDGAQYSGTQPLLYK